MKFWAGLWFAQFLLFYLFSKFQNVVSFFELFFQAKQYIHQTIFSKIPFSIGDVFYTFLLFYIFIALYKIIKKNDSSKYLKQIFIVLNVLYFVYQLCWGMMYFQKPIIEKLHQQKISIAQLETLTKEFILLTNKARENVNEDEKGNFKIKNLESVKKSILKNEINISKKYYSHVPVQINNFKPSLFGAGMNYTGILGYYNPFSSEAQYNPHLPDTYIPFTLSHESAHQLGFAREQEASFIGFLICERSNNPELHYSAYLYTSKSLLNYLLDYDPNFVKKSKLIFSKKVQKDLENEKEFNQHHDTFLRSSFHFLNDIFLKTNQQEGTVTYNYYLELLARYKIRLHK